MDQTTDAPTKRSSLRRQQVDPNIDANAPAPEGEPTAEAASPAAVVEPPAMAVPVPEPIAVAAKPEVILRLPGQAPLPATHSPGPQPTEPTLPNSPFRRHDVVQVIDIGSRHFGMFFMVGDHYHNKVHGYYMQPGLHKEYITIEAHHCLYIGRPETGSKAVRSSQPCSPKWIADRGASRGGAS